MPGQLPNSPLRGAGPTDMDLRFARRDATNAADVVLTDQDSQFISLNPTAARNVTLPVLTNKTGLMYVISNRAASGSGFNLTIKDSGAVTLAVVPPVTAALVYNNGTGWIILLGAAVTVEG